MPEIVDFQSFLQVAKTQPEPQRLLFLFLKTGLPDDHDAKQAERFKAGQGGALVPLMYVDKRPEELSTFEALNQESHEMGEPWQIMLAAAMSGQGGQPPSEIQADEALKLMVKTVHGGGDLSCYLAFDPEGELLRFMQPEPGHPHL